MTHDEITDRAIAGTLTKDEAIAYALDRLDEMFEALIGISPTRPANTPPHIVLVARIPTLTDYAMFARRANESSRLVEIAEERRDKAVHAANDSLLRAYAAEGILRDARKTLTAALNHLDAHAETPPNPNAGE